MQTFHEGFRKGVSYSKTELIEIEKVKIQKLETNKKNKSQHFQMESILIG